LGISLNGRAVADLDCPNQRVLGQALFSLFSSRLCEPFALSAVKGF
jgi:hypothetical protein